VNNDFLKYQSEFPQKVNIQRAQSELPHSTSELPFLRTIFSHVESEPLKIKRTFVLLEVNFRK
jgi:hypothetical protein